MKPFCHSLSVGMLILVVGGCGESGPSSVTENADQAAIDEYKAMEAKIIAESEAELGESGALD
ncbi:MAG: hypothetical protein AAGC97_04365 [Planctomycetota bacterium]